jgi:sterol desaturase/sphingolipid hydroxylase (fatty acid hydroxylase superfamily)
MSLPEILALLILPIFLVIDLVLRRRRRGLGSWRLRALGVTTINFGLSLGVGAAWAAFFGEASLLPGDRLGTVGGAVVGVVCYEFAHYWYHRTAHRFDALWRLGHQMHHSPEVLDPWGAYFLHPLDATIFLSLTSIVLFPVLGLTPAAGAWAAAFLTFAAVFQHASFRTPRWIGYLVQRPESHAIHHERGVHAFNYSDLPLWDLVFGTFRNGTANEALPSQGFYDGASSRLLEMLSFRDVSSAKPQPPSLG